MKYVVGIMFDTALENICVIKKNRPEWQAGKYNCPGGKIEENEFPIIAMIREFKEETGVDWTSWQYLYTNISTKATVTFFYARTDEVFNAKDMEDEEVSVIGLDVLPEFPTVGDLTMHVRDALMALGEKVRA